MSTRTQIEFILKCGDKIIEKYLTYRHSDGYPNGVIPDLVKFLRWIEPRLTQLDYTIANYFYYMKRTNEDHLKQMFNEGMFKKDTIELRNKQLNQYLMLGLGINNKEEIQGDIDYFYQVIVNVDNFDFLPCKHKDIEIRCYKVPQMDMSYTDIVKDTNLEGIIELRNLKENKGNIITNMYELDTQLLRDAFKEEYRPTIIID